MKPRVAFALFAVLVMGFAVLCWLCALAIPPTGQGAPGLAVTPNIAASTVRLLRHLRADPRLFWGAMVTSWFWLAGIVALSLLPTLVKGTIGGDEETVTAYLVIFSVAVGAGSALAATIARGRIVLTTTIVGAALLGLVDIDLGFMFYGAALTALASSPRSTFSSPPS